MNEVVPSLSDIAAVCGNRNGNGNDGFGGEGSWAWVLIFLIFAFGGWGRNGNGFGGGSNGGGIADNYVLASDFANISRQIDSTAATTERKLDSISNGICSLGYDQLRELNGINTNIMNNGYETRLGVNNLGSQLATCCCDIRQQISDCCCQNLRALDGVNYNLATNFGTLNNTLCTLTRDVIDNQNANYRALHDEIVANRIEDKNAQIQMQQNEINALRLSASQEKQNNYLIDQLKPCPVPAFLTCNPYQSFNYGLGYGCNNSCGCNGNII